MIKRCNCHPKDHYYSLLRPENKLLHGLYVRLCDLQDALSDVYFKQRPFLTEPTDKPVILDDVVLLREEKQLEREIEEVKKAINFEEFLVEKKRKASLPPPVQTKLLVDNPTSIV